MLKRYLLKDVGIDFGGDAVILYWGTSVGWFVTHPSFIGRVTADWREDDVEGEGGAIVAKDGKTPKVFCNSQCRPAHNLVPQCLRFSIVFLFVFVSRVRIRVFGWKKYISCCWREMWEVKFSNLSKIGKDGLSSSISLSFFPFFPGCCCCCWKCISHA